MLVGYCDSVGYGSSPTIHDERVMTVLKCKKSICVLLVMIFFAALVAGCAPTPPEQPIIDTPKPDTELMETYPNYFGLDASNGLDVYVWQMAAHSYSFGVLPHSDTPRDWISNELMHMRGTGAAQMRQILASYDIDKSQIHIIPWQNPLSSYIGDFWIVLEGEDAGQVREEYLKFLETMLFGGYSYPVFADCVFDVDKDGKEEYCVLSGGETYGAFSFAFSAFSAGSLEPKYEKVFDSEFCELSFRYDFRTDRMYIKAVTQGEEPQTCYYDVAIENGEVKLALTDYDEPEMFLYPAAGQ